MSESKEERIDALIEKLTLEEKASLLAAADMWHTMPIPRLDIPSIQVTDGPNGVRGHDDNIGKTSVCFPVGTAMGATWNPDLVKKVGSALAAQVKVKNAQVLLAPTVNIHRTPNAGRNFECYSEDPLLSGIMASAFINGVQETGVAACIKHFVCNDQEFERFSISAEIGERPLHEIYLQPFRIALSKANPWSVMSAYNRINGRFASENKQLLGHILKEKWGYDGLVMSDWYGTYSTEVPAGDLDLEMPGPARWMDVEKIAAAVNSGQLSELLLDGKVRRLLRLIDRVGGFEEAREEDLPQANSPQEKALARETAVEAIVLLKNEDNLLPIKLDQVNKIAVIGENAYYAKIMGGGSSEVNPHYVISPLTGMQNRVGNQAEIAFEIGAPFYKDAPLLDMTWAQSNSGQQGALTLEYFDNRELAGPAAKTADVFKTNLSWFGPVNPFVDLSNFSLRLSGHITAPQSAQYEFSINNIGRVRLTIDDKILLDDWQKADELEERRHTVKAALQAGHPVKMSLEYSTVPDTRWRNVRLGVFPIVPQDPIQKAVDLAAQSDLAIVVAGLSKEWESEGFDRPDLALPGQQNELIRRVAEANPRTIVLLNAGSPLEMPWIDQVPALLQTWYLGQETGNALAAVLFGDENPCGKLPTSFPKRYEDNPAFINYPGENGQVHYGEGIFVGYRYYDKKRIDPLFPFGHGLSYTTFSYDNLALNQTKMGQNDSIEVSFEVTNNGQYPGKEIAQLYIRDDETKVARPEKELKGFSKFHLHPGQSKTITLEVSKYDLAYYDTAENAWTVQPGRFTVLIGSSSRAIHLQRSFTYSGD